jgi:hypothetical protein
MPMSPMAFLQPARRFYSYSATLRYYEQLFVAATPLIRQFDTSRAIAAPTAFLAPTWCDPGTART